MFSKEVLLVEVGTEGACVGAIAVLAVALPILEQCES